MTPACNIQSEMFLINRDYNIVMNQRRSLLQEGREWEVELDVFSVVVSTYFVKGDYLMKHDIPVV